MSQRTLVLLKPDAVRRGLIGEIISRIERKAGWQITALELRTLDQDTLEQHYGEHKGKPFYEPLVEFMASGPVVALIVEGERVIEGVRALAGPTDPIAAAPGSIRGDYGDDRPGEPDPRLGLRGVRRARGEDLLPRPLIPDPADGSAIQRSGPGATEGISVALGICVRDRGNASPRTTSPQAERSSSADNGGDPRAVFVQARLRWKPSRHSTHLLADLKSPQSSIWEGQTNPDGELNVVHRP